MGAPWLDAIFRLHSPSLSIWDNMIARLSLILPVWASGYVCCSITDFMNKFCVQFRNGIQASIVANSAGLPGHSAPVADMPLATLQKPTLLGGVEAACCSRGAQEKKTEGRAVVLVKVSGRANLIWVFSNDRRRGQGWIGLTWRAYTWSRTGVDCLAGIARNLITEIVRLVLVNVSPGVTATVADMPVPPLNSPLYFWLITAVKKLVVPVVLRGGNKGMCWLPLLRYCWSLFRLGVLE